LAGRVDEIRRAGADLVLIGNGRPDQATAFARDEVPGVTVLTDPSLRTYRALDLRRGVLATFGPRSALAAAKATLRGHRQTATAGDPWQQGGLAVVTPGGRILFVQQNRDAGDRPDLDGALRALRPS
jgi:hypothetical protein